MQPTIEGEYQSYSDSLDARRPRHRKQAVIVLLAVLAVAVVFGVWRWHQYTANPLYSLQLLEEAVRAQDPVEVARFCDVHAIAGDVYEAAAADVGSAALGEDFSWLLEGVSGVAKPFIVERLADRFFAVILAEPDHVLQGMIPDPANVTIERGGSVAIASMRLADGRDIRYRMLPNNGRWRIVGLDNADEVYGHLMETAGLNILR